MMCVTCNKVPAACKCGKGSPWRDGMYPANIRAVERAGALIERAEKVRERREVIIGKSARDKATTSRESRLRLGHEL